MLTTKFSRVAGALTPFFGTITNRVDRARFARISFLMAKPKKTKTAADILFQSAPSHVRELHEQSKKLKRNASRSIWWDENKDKFLK